MSSFEFPPDISGHNPFIALTPLAAIFAEASGIEKIEALHDNFLGLTTTHGMPAKALPPAILLRADQNRDIDHTSNSLALLRSGDISDHPQRPTLDQLRNTMGKGIMSLSVQYWGLTLSVHNLRQPTEVRDDLELSKSYLRAVGLARLVGTRQDTNVPELFSVTRRR